LLADDGYLLLRALLEGTVVSRMKDRLDELVADFGTKIASASASVPRAISCC